MWTFLNKTLGLTVPFQVPFDTPEEYDRLAGEAGSWKVDLAAGLCYSQGNKIFGDKILPAVEAFCGVQADRETVTVKGVEREEYTVTPKVFIGKMLADKKITMAQLQQLANEIAKTLEPLKVEGSRGPAKPAKHFMDNAVALLDTLAKNGRPVEDWAAAAASKYPGCPEPSEDGYDQTFVARVLQHISNAQAAAQANL